MISPDDPYQDLILENPQEYFLPFLGTGRESNNDIWVPARHILFDPAQPGYFCVGVHWGVGTVPAAATLVMLGFPGHLRFFLEAVTSQRLGYQDGRFSSKKQQQDG